MCILVVHFQPHPQHITPPASVCSEQYPVATVVNGLCTFLTGPLRLNFHPTEGPYAELRLSTSHVSLKPLQYILQQSYYTLGVNVPWFLYSQHILSKFSRIYMLKRIALLLHANLLNLLKRPFSTPTRGLQTFSMYRNISTISVISRFTCGSISYHVRDRVEVCS
jgi:hypothetical protein